MEDEHDRDVEQDGVDAKTDDPIQRWQLGGSQSPIVFTAGQAEVLHTLADVMVPPGEGFPAPSEVGILDFIARYVNRSGIGPQYFPHADESRFLAVIDELGKRIGDDVDTDQVELVRNLETTRPDFFSELRALIYFGYYSRPEVVKCIRQCSSGGRDYRGQPQPYGYLDVIEEWEYPVGSAGRSGTYTPTEAVTRLVEPRPDSAASTEVATHQPKGI